MEAGADKDALDENGASPLIFGAMNGHLAVVQRLLAADLDVDHADEAGITPLLFAVQNSHPDVVR